MSQPIPNNTNIRTEEEWLNTFNSTAKATRTYMDTQENRRKLLDLELDVKKAELAEKKIDDKEFRVDVAKMAHPHNFLARWKLRISYRIEQHNNRKNDLNKFKAGQKTEREEIKQNLDKAMKDQVDMKENYVKSYKSRNGAWFESAKTHIQKYNENTREAREENIQRFDTIKDMIDQKKREDAESIKEEAERLPTQDEIDAEYYAGYKAPEAPQANEPIPERRQLDLSIARIEKQIKPQQPISAQQPAKDDPSKQERSIDPLSKD